MIDNVLSGKKTSVKLTVKSVISLGVVALAALLPQLVHLAAGPAGGMTWLPMYLPVLLGGCLLGWRWGLGVGILSPLASFAVTSAMGSAMPAAARLPYMIAELAVFAAVSGMFSRKIAENVSRRPARVRERSSVLHRPRRRAFARILSGCRYGMVADPDGAGRAGAPGGRGAFRGDGHKRTARTLGA